MLCFLRSNSVRLSHWPTYKGYIYEIEEELNVMDLHANIVDTN